AIHQHLDVRAEHRALAGCCLPVSAQAIDDHIALAVIITFPPAGKLLHWNVPWLSTVAGALNCRDCRVKCNRFAAVAIERSPMRKRCEVYAFNLAERLGRSRLPSLAKEGWTRHQQKIPVPMKGADGVVGSN